MVARSRTLDSLVSMMSDRNRYYTLIKRRARPHLISGLNMPNG